MQTEGNKFPFSQHNDVIIICETVHFLGGGESY
jgi:hypothetical protein